MSNSNFNISRRIYSRNVVSPEVFKIARTDLFLFTGIEKEELCKLVGSRHVYLSRNKLRQSSQIQAKYIILELNSDFDRICSKTDLPVHWLHHESSGKLTWVKSKGTLTAFQEAFDSKLQSGCSEDEFLCHLENQSQLYGIQPVIISGPAGSGKSMVLANLAISLRQQYPERIVNVIVFNEFLKGIKDPPECLTREGVEKALEFNGITSIGDALRSGIPKVELMFDEVDQDEFSKSCSDCFQFIQESYTNVRIWVATSPPLLPPLENTLQVVGFDIGALSEQDEVQIIVSYWTSQPAAQQLGIDSSKFFKFAVQMLNMLKEDTRNNVRSDLEGNTKGNPLLCRLIAQVYQEDALKYSSISSDQPLPSKILPVPQLFQKAIDIMLGKHLGKTPSKENLWGEHVYWSVYLIFPSSADLIKTRLNLNLTSRREALLRCGIIDSWSTTNEPRFAHKSFAEYFVASFVVESVTKGSPDRELGNFFLQWVFQPEAKKLKISDYGWFNVETFKFKYDSVCYFINGLLPPSLEFEAVSSDSTEMNAILVNKIVHSCAYHDTLQIFYLFQEIARHHASQDSNVFNDILLYVTVEQSSLNLISRLCRSYEEFGNRKVNKVTQLWYPFITTVLHAAVENREYPIVDYLLTNHGFEPILQEAIISTKWERHRAASILHACLSDSKGDSLELVSEKLQTLRRLVTVNKKLLEEDTDGVKPLLCPFIHPQLLQELVFLGVDLCAVNADSETVFHKCTTYLTPEEYFQFIENLPQDKLTSIFKMKNWQEKTPLHSVVHNMEPDDDILAIFQKCQADFNSLDCHRDSILATAIKQNRQIACLRQLIAHGADYKIIACDKTSLLHVAAECGNKPVVRFLLDKGIPVNIKDKFGHTPAYYSVVGWFGSRFKVAVVLKEQGGKLLDSGKSSDKESTIIHTAVRDWNFEGVRILVHVFGMSLNYQDTQSNTPLHLVMKSKHDDESGGRFEMTKFLLENGADIHATDKDGQTSFECALRQKKPVIVDSHLLTLFETHGGISSADIAYSTISHMITNNDGWELKEYEEMAFRITDQWSGDLNLNKTDEDENTLLHLAASARCCPGVRFLCENKGLDVNAQNSNLKTPLHQAILGKGESALDTIQTLIKFGADLKALDRENNTLLYNAVTSGLDADSVQQLVDTGVYDDSLQERELICQAVKTASVEVVSLLCTKYLKLTGKTVVEISPEGATLLHVAVEKGRYSTLEYLLNEETPEEILKAPCMNDLLHQCVRNTVDYSFCSDSAKIDERVKIISLLTTKHPDLANFKDDQGRTPLHMEGVNLRLLQCLIDNGTDARLTNNDGDNIAHLATAYLRREDYSHLVNHLVEKDFQDLLTSKGKQNATVLHRAVHKLEMMQFALEVFKNHGADFNAVDDNKMSVLMYAVKGQRSKKFIKTLVRTGSRWKRASVVPRFLVAFSKH